MNSQIQSIPIDKFAPHPDSPNRMSKGNFAKLVRNIERTGRYEPLVVRPCPATNCHSCESRNPDTNREARRDCFQVINGHHRWRALHELGYRSVDAVVWDIDDTDTDILLVTLNRLGGSNILDKKLTLLCRLNERIESRDLAKLLPHTAGQIRRLTRMNRDGLTAGAILCGCPGQARGPAPANPKVFFLDDVQHEIVEKALSLAQEGQNKRTRAARNAAALTCMARCFIESTRPT